MEEEETYDSQAVAGTQEGEIEIPESPVVCAEASQREEASEAELLQSGSFVRTRGCERAGARERAAGAAGSRGHANTAAPRERPTTPPKACGGRVLWRAQRDASPGWPNGRADAARWAVAAVERVTTPRTSRSY